MARLSPYLQLLLARKRPVDTATNPPDVGPSTTEQPAPIGAPSPVTIGARSTNSMAIAPTTNLDPLVDIQPRTAETVQGYDRGLHPDKDIPQMMVPYKRNRGMEIAEGIGNTLASGFGVNLQSILHPRGTDEQRARRALRDEQGIEAVKLQERRVGAEEQRANADEARAGSYADHLKNIEEQAGIQLHDRSGNEPIIRPNKDGSYSTVYTPPVKPEKNTPPHNPLIVEVKNADGSTTRKQSDDYGKTWHEAEGLGDAAPLPKPEKDDSVDTGAYGELESGFRANAKTANDVANKAEADAKQYIAEQKLVNPSYDPRGDPNVASLTAEATRQRAFAAKQTDKADQVAVKKVTVGSKRTKSGSGASETTIRQAATAAGLNPDKAVQRAHHRGILR